MLTESGESVEYGECEGAGFTGTGLCAAEDIASAECFGNGECLDGSWCGVSLGVDGAKDGLCEAQF